VLEFRSLDNSLSKSILDVEEFNYKTLSIVFSMPFNGRGHAYWIFIAGPGNSSFV